MQAEPFFSKVRLIRAEGGKELGGALWGVHQNFKPRDLASKQSCATWVGLCT